MGFSCSTIFDGGSRFNPMSSEYLQELLHKSQITCNSFSDTKTNNISLIKEEIVYCLNQNNIGLAKEKMYNLLKEEDYIVIYDLLARILEIMKPNCAYLASSRKFPLDLRIHLDTILYASTRVGITDLFLFREQMIKKYGLEYINRAYSNADGLVNVVIFEKLRGTSFSDEYIMARLKQLCTEKNINYKFPDDTIPEGIEENNAQIHESNIYESKHPSFPIKKVSQSINWSYKQGLNSNIPQEEKQNSIQFNDELEKNLDIIKKGESIFLPNDENIDKKCYSLNKIDNWAESFYNLKSGVLLEKYKEIVSKTENAKFFEALNYEYGINNSPLDTNKAFKIYKTAADTSTDTLSMYRLYHIYKKDFKKFNIKERNHVLEKFYLLKCFTYLTPKQKTEQFYNRFRIWKEINIIIIEEEKKPFAWYNKFLKFLEENYKIYNINKDDIILIEVVIYYYFLEKNQENIYEKIFNLADKGNPEAMFNLINFDYLEEEEENKKIFEKNREKLYKMNYYRGFYDYVLKLPYGKEALSILKKSILNGYYYNIIYYSQVFFMINELDDIFKSPELKSELIFIFKFFIYNIIVDEIDILIHLVYIRKIAIKHYNFGEEFKTNLDPLLKEAMNNLIKFISGTYEENKKLITSYYIYEYYYQLFYSIFGYIYYYGMKGIIERNYNEALNIFNYLLKNDETFYIDKFYYHFIYSIKINQRKKNMDKNDKDEELIKLEKNLLNMYYKELSGNIIKKKISAYFYIFSRLFRSSSVNNEDKILEYVFLNRAANASMPDIKGTNSSAFEAKYFRYKALKKIDEKNKEENFNIKDAKGAINVGGYGENGTICPICLENQKSIICLPCRHFFCRTCMDLLLDKGKCPICRANIKITFDIDLKKEKLIKSIIANSYRE